MKSFTIHDIAVAWTNKINHYAQKEGIEFQKMVLGMEILLHNIPKLILMIMVAYFLDILPQTLITWLSFACIRRYACGLHATNSITCAIMTIIMFVAVPYVLRDIHFNVVVFILILTIIAIGLYKYAPADTAMCPILGKKKRAKFKKNAVLSCLSVLILTLVLLDKAFYELVAFGAIYALIAVLPITYKILKRSMNNYEQYE